MRHDGLGDGSFPIRPAHSGKSLEVFDSNANDGALVSSPETVAIRTVIRTSDRFRTRCSRVAGIQPDTRTGLRWGRQG